MFDIDLGAFELVDSGVTAEALLSHDDPVIYHKDMPVHSVHHQTGIIYILALLYVNTYIF